MSQIKYPNGKTFNQAVKQIKSETGAKQVRRRAGGRANMGMQLESDVISSCQIFRERGWAVIYKRPTPIRIVRVDPENPSHITSSFFAEKSTTDFVGIYRSRYIDFECKESSRDTLELTNIRPQQLTHLNSVLKSGGIGFFLVCFTKRQEVYLLDAHYVLDSALKAGSRSGFKRELFQEKGRLIAQGYAPRLEILKAIDEEYFDTPFDPNNPNR